MKGEAMSAQAEMPRYKCHKEVHAVQIAAIEVHEDGSATIAPKDAGFATFKTAPKWADRFQGTDEDPGYYVVYSDGFASWSPSKAFESGYSRI